jgi:Protein of unknown function (DUF3558)
MAGRSMTSRVGAVLALAALLGFGASGCSIGNGDTSNDYCNPVGCVAKPPPKPPEDSRTPETTAYEPMPDPNPDDPDNWWERVDPCTLIPESEGSQVGFPVLGRSGLNAGWQRTCYWRTDQGSLTITLSSERYDLLFLDYRTTNITTSDGRPGQQALLVGGSVGACYLTVRATEGSRVYIQTTVKGSSAQACRTALAAANAMGPNLPTG